MLQWQFITKVSSIYKKIKYHSYTHIIGVCLLGKREEEIWGTEKEKQNFQWYVSQDSYSYFLYVVEGFQKDTRTPI